MPSSLSELKIVVDSATPATKSLLSSKASTSWATSYVVHGAVLVSLLYVSGNRNVDRPMVDIQAGVSSIELTASIAASSAQPQQVAIPKAQPPAEVATQEPLATASDLRMAIDAEAQRVVDQAITDSQGQTLEQVSKTIRKQQQTPVSEVKTPDSLISEPPQETQPKKAVTSEATPESQALPEADAQVGADVDRLPHPLQNNPPPQYPTTAMQQGQQGKVLLLVHVSAKGIVTRLSVQTSSGFTELDQAAINAVSNWKFQPATRNGKPIDFEIEVPLRFLLDPA